MGRYVGLLLARRHPAKQATLVRKSTLGDKLFALKLLDATLQLRNLALVEFYGLRRGGHRNRCLGGALMLLAAREPHDHDHQHGQPQDQPGLHMIVIMWLTDRKSTRLNSSHITISYAVFCLKKKKNTAEHYVEHAQPNPSRR